jgi:hypothetical protein
MSKTTKTSNSKTTIKIAAIALALGVIGVGQAQAAYNTKIGRNHTHSTSAATSIPALMVFGRAMNAVAEDPGAPNHAWAERASLAFQPQNGWPTDDDPLAPDGPAARWEVQHASAVRFADLWLSKLAARLASRTYASPDAVLDEATKLIEGSDSAWLQQQWASANAAAAGKPQPDLSNGGDVHFFLSGAGYRANAQGWSIEQNNGIWFGSASGGQERIAGRVYTLDVRNGDEFSHGTDASRRMLGGN